MLLLYMQEGILLDPQKKTKPKQNKLQEITPQNNQLPRKNTLIQKVGFNFGKRVSWGFPGLFYYYILC